MATACFVSKAKCWVPFATVAIALVAGPVRDTQASSAVECVQHDLKIAALNLDPNPVKQEFTWEVVQNAKGYPEKPGSTPIGAILLDRSEVQIKEVEGGAPQHIRDYFEREGKVLWLKHPYNVSPKDLRYSGYFMQSSFKNAPETAYFHVPPTLDLPAYFSASRSMGLNLDHPGQAFSAKMPTARPHSSLEPGKLYTDSDIEVGLARTDQINSVDRHIGKDPSIVILKDVYAIVPKSNKNGILIRDLSPLQDGHYWFPAVSIGSEDSFKIAALHGQDFTTFWGEHYPTAVGRLKAKALLRYGIQWVTPNAQQFLLQMDKNLTLTGVIAVRDASDTAIIEALVKPFGFEKIFSKEPKPDRPEWRSVLPSFGAGNAAIPHEMVSDWRAREAIEYAREIVSALQISGSRIDLPDEERKLAEFLSARKKVMETPEGHPGRKAALAASLRAYEAFERADWRINLAIREFFNSEEGQAALKQYRERLLQGRH